MLDLGPVPHGGGATLEALAGQLPYDLGGKAAAAPRAVRAGGVQGDVGDRLVRGSRVREEPVLELRLVARGGDELRELGVGHLGGAGRDGRDQFALTLL